MTQRAFLQQGFKFESQDSATYLALLCFLSYLSNKSACLLKILNKDVLFYRLRLICGFHILTHQTRLCRSNVTCWFQMLTPENAKGNNNIDKRKAVKRENCRSRFYMS